MPCDYVNCGVWTEKKNPCCLNLFIGIYTSTGIIGRIHTAPYSSPKWFDAILVKGKHEDLNEGLLDSCICMLAKHPESEMENMKHKMKRV